jgi:hypothetical protein
MRFAVHGQHDGPVLAGNVYRVLQDFDACGMPRLFKQESKTTCTGKMSADQAAGRIIIVDGCRGMFVPEF